MLDVGDLRRLRRTDASMHVVNGGRDRAREQAVLFGAVEEPLALDYPVREVGRQPERWHFGEQARRRKRAAEIPDEGPNQKSSSVQSSVQSHAISRDT